MAPTLAAFASGVEVMSFNVTITPDMISELNETFLLELQQIPSIVQDPSEGRVEGLVEDLVVDPDEATVVITDVTGMGLDLPNSPQLRTRSTLYPFCSFSLQTWFVSASPKVHTRLPKEMGQKSSLLLLIRCLHLNSQLL